MTPNDATLKIIAGWVASLVDVTQHAEGKPTKSAIATYATLLGGTFPSAAFTAESLAHVVDGQAWFPAVAVVTTRLHEWWRDHKPAAAPMLTDQRAMPEGWKREDQEWLDLWYRRLGENIDLAAKRNLLSFIRCQSARAWGLITEQPAPRGPTPDEEARVAGVVSSLRASVERSGRAAMPPMPDVTAKGVVLSELRARARNQIGLR